jgi:hypothetical protein
MPDISNAYEYEQHLRSCGVNGLVAELLVKLLTQSDTLMAGVEQLQYRVETLETELSTHRHVTGSVEYPEDLI